jgi:hypothetical protein
MFQPFMVGHVRILAACAAATGAIALLAATDAHAQNLAACRFQAHVTLSAGAFSSIAPGDASCTGMIDGALAGSDGLFTAHGTYTGTACSTTSWRGTFIAQVPRAISFFDPQYAQVSGSMQALSMGDALIVSGGGSIDGQAVRYMGTGTFSRDGAVTCSGTLTENVVISPTSGSEPSGSQVALATPIRHHRHHHRRRRHQHRAK